MLPCLEIWVKNKSLPQMKFQESKASAVNPRIREPQSQDENEGRGKNIQSRAWGDGEPGSEWKCEETLLSSSSLAVLPEAMRCNVLGFMCVHLFLCLSWLSDLHIYLLKIRAFFSWSPPSILGCLRNTELVPASHFQLSMQNLLL